MVVSYTTNYSQVDPYGMKNNNQMQTNADGGGNGGAFLKMFEDTESDDSKTSKETKVEYATDTPSLYADYQASESVIRDYIDNSLLLNTEQVACTNIAQHLALKSNVKETLKFLNTQAAKNMVNSRKRNYNFQTKPVESAKTTAENNFFKTVPNKNFFLL